MVMREDKLSPGHLQISPGDMEWDSLSNQLEHELFLIRSKTRAEYSSEWDTAGLALGKWTGSQAGLDANGLSYKWPHHPPHLIDKDFQPVHLKLTGHNGSNGQSSVIIILSTSLQTDWLGVITIPSQSCHLHFYNFLAQFTRSTK